MTERPLDTAAIEDIWRDFLERGAEGHLRQRRLFRLLPTDPRCKFCNAPFRGAGAAVVRAIYGKRPSVLNPRICNICETFAQEHQGGAELELSMLFADVRGSTGIAERMSPGEFSRLINRFYKVGTDVLIRSDALVDKLIGDQVTGLYVPGFAGADHARIAVDAAQELLKVTGHLESTGPWIPLGAGVHTGVAFVGAVGSAEGLTDITVLGDAANTAARLASQAAVGEILVSEEAARAAKLDTAGLEHRQLELKGREQPVSVSVLTVSSS
jgi:adenylate cyclase